MDTKEPTDSEKSLAEFKTMLETLQTNHDQHAQNIEKLQKKLDCIERTIATKPNITKLLEIEQESLARAQASMQIVEQQIEHEQQHVDSMSSKGTMRK